MAGAESMYLGLVPRLVREHFLLHPGELSDIATAAILKVDNRESLMLEFKFDEGLHRRLHNRKNAKISTGCGCKICVTRHEYTKTKLQLHRAKRAFESDFFYCPPDSDDPKLRAINAEYFRKERELYYDRVYELESQIKKLKQLKDSIFSQLCEVGVIIVEG